MKNLLLAGIIGAAFTVSCSTAKTAQSNKSEFLKLKGDWEITSVDYNKDFKVRPFDEGADAQCFVGSHWRLIPNNYSGSYTLNGGGACPSVIQPIKFEVVNGNEFKFKNLNKKSPKNIGLFDIVLKIYLLFTRFLIGFFATVDFVGVAL